MGKLLSLPGASASSSVKEGLDHRTFSLPPRSFSKYGSRNYKEKLSLEKKKVQVQKKIQDLILKISRKVILSRHCQISLGPRAEDEAKLTLSSSSP